MPRSTAQVVGESMIFLTIDLLAFSGNLLVCLAMYRNPRLRTTTNIYITTLAVSDILNSLIVQPLTVGTIMTGRWVAGSYGCKVHGFFNLYLSYVSIQTMTLTAVNRYFRVVKPKYYHKVFSNTKSILYVVVLWSVISLTVWLPPTTGWSLYMFFPDNSVCAQVFVNEIASVTYEAIFFNLVPISVVAFCYYNVSKTIRQHNANVAASINRASLSVEEIRITRTLFALVVAFVLCTVPAFTIFGLLRLRLTSFTSIPRGVSLMANALIFTSSAVNPFLYGVMNNSFRMEFKKILSCHCQKGHYEPNSSSQGDANSTNTSSRSQQNTLNNQNTMNTLQ